MFCVFLLKTFSEPPNLVSTISVLSNNEKKNLNSSSEKCHFFTIINIGVDVMHLAHGIGGSLSD